MHPFMSARAAAFTFAALAACACSAAPAPAPEYPPLEPPAAEADVSPAAPAAGVIDPHGGHATPVAWTLDGMAKGAVLLPDLGAHRRAVTTSVPEAQAFFDQGLALAYGFNHDEAARSFARAAQLDPTCAMCFWGAALTLGPNYNIPMLAERAAAAWDALQHAQAAAASAAPVEQALIAALAERYKGPEYVEPPAMAPYNQAYAAAMWEVAKKFPADADVQVLAAEAQMDVNPWQLWKPDGQPAPGTEDIVKALEGVLAKAPDHPGANHYYIHAVEASKTPGRALASADRLPSLMPGAGHIVHMPAHIYQRVGRYADASKANQRAIAADEKYLATITPLGYYAFYLGHNHGFLAYSASMEGRSQVALEAARASAAATPRDLVCGMPGMDFFLSEPLLVMVRFGRFDTLLHEPKPDAKYAVLNGLWHHARGMALAATGKLDEARAEVNAIRAIETELPGDLLANLNSGKAVLELAAKVVDARIAEAQKSPDAIAQWQDAVALEDGMAYAEPADWFYPTRHYLGAALLDAGRPKEAEAVYRADLERNPKNGWALYGVWQAMLAQKRTAEARAAEKAFRAAWAGADFELKRSAF
jgi:tetratricopeptide (TPR) repeat protein